MSAPRADFHMDGQTLSALSAASTAHWRLAGHISLRYQVLWIVREQHGAQATYAFTPTEWSDRSFKADGKRLRVFSEQPVITGLLVCQLCKSEFVSEEDFTRHKQQDNAGEAEYRKRVLFLMAESGCSPITFCEASQLAAFHTRAPARGCPLTPDCGPQYHGETAPGACTSVAATVHTRQFEVGDWIKMTFWGKMSYGRVVRTQADDRYVEVAWCSHGNTDRRAFSEWVRPEWIEPWL